MGVKWRKKNTKLKFPQKVNKCTYLLNKYPLNFRKVSNKLLLNDQSILRPTKFLQRLNAEFCRGVSCTYLPKKKKKNGGKIKP